MASEPVLGGGLNPPIKKNLHFAFGDERMDPGEHSGAGFTRKDEILNAADFFKVWGEADFGGHLGTC